MQHYFPSFRFADSMEMATFVALIIYFGLIIISLSRCETREVFLFAENKCSIYFADSNIMPIFAEQLGKLLFHFK